MPSPTSKTRKSKGSYKRYASYLTELRKDVANEQNTLNTQHSSASSTSQQLPLGPDSDDNMSVESSIGLLPDSDEGSILETSYTMRAQFEKVSGLKEEMEKMKNENRKLHIEVSNVKDLAAKQYVLLKKIAGNVFGDSARDIDVDFPITTTAELETIEKKLEDPNYFDSFVINT